MQVRLIKELYGNQIGELYHSFPYNMVEFVLDDLDWLVFCVDNKMVEFVLLKIYLVC